MRITAGCEAQIIAAYGQMAREAHYRPAAPSDGFGNIAVPEEELDLDAEARQYAAHWWEEENERRSSLGCANHRERVAMIYAVEAARHCCSGSGRSYARRLLKMALRELEGR